MIQIDYSRDKIKIVLMLKSFHIVLKPFGIFIWGLTRYSRTLSNSFEKMLHFLLHPNLTINVLFKIEKKVQKTKSFYFTHMQ